MLLKDSQYLLEIIILIRILVDGTLLNEIIIPTMNVDRRLADGSRHREEVVNKS